ncbi:uncharacterized protein [Linepithema humile]|uniref:uncharacterized protein isoform X2 n=1 Tax=Linepithema humile TaxID=83485 RepID=UPI00351DD18A
MKVLGKTGKVADINLQDWETEVMPGFCDKTDKQLKTPRLQTRGLERPPTTLPTCHHCSRYPPGCTVLEYRLEADRPVVRIVQVPADTAAQNSCSLVTRLPFSRKISRRKDTKQQASSIKICSQDQIANKFILLPASYFLKSQDCTDKSVVLAGKVSKTILEVNRSEEQLDSPISKILYCPLSNKFFETFYSDDKTRNQPMILIEHAPTSENPLATQCLASTDDKIPYYICLESKLKDDSPGKVIRQVIDATDTISDERTKHFCGQDLSGQGIPCQRTKPEVTCRFPPDKLTCRDGADLKIDISPCSRTKDLLSHVPRRNGLDSSEIRSFSKKELSKKIICPASCCQPVQRSTTKEVCEDSSQSRRKAAVLCVTSSPIKVRTSQDRLDDQRHLQRPVSEQILQTEAARIESAKSAKAFVHQTAAVTHVDLIPERIFGDAIQLLGSQEPPACYKKHIAAYQPEKRYEVCRSKRNGLQNEYVRRIEQSGATMYLG